MSEPKEAAPPRGLRCPRCGCTHFLTLSTQHRPDRIRRYKVCRHCGRSLVTYEVTAAQLRKE